MPIELQCGECSGVLAVEEPGGMVACPHCGAHLMVAAPQAPELVMVGAGLAGGGGDVSAGLGDLESGSASEPKTEVLPDAVQPAPCDPPTETIPDAASHAVSSVIQTPVDSNAATVPFQLPPLDTTSSTVTPPTGNSLTETAPFSLPEKSSRVAGTAPAATKTETADEPMVPKAWLHWALTACSILGILVLALGYAVTQQAFRRYQLESLPDLAPPKARSSKQSVTLINVPFDAPMAPLHTLKLGETRRFGNLEVTPLRVERSPIEFSHFDATVKEKKAPSAPVLKLVMRVKNVGGEPFVPFDHDLLFAREPDPKKIDLLRANNFVCGPDGRRDKGHRVLMFDQTEGAVWDLKDQLCGRELTPGETVETYLATEEQGLDKLSGDLVWRVHFRKGHNSNSGRGVTTLIEVEFNSDDVDA